MRKLKKNRVKKHHGAIVKLTRQCRLFPSKKKYIRLKTKLKDGYIIYALARKDSQWLFKKAKDGSWIKCIEKLTTMCTQHAGDFYKSIKAMRE